MIEYINLYLNFVILIYLIIIKIQNDNLKDFKEHKVKMIFK